MRKSTQNIQVVKNYLLYLSVFCLPLYQKVSIGCWLVLGMMGLFQKKWVNFPSDKVKRLLLFLSAGFYLWHAVAMLWTTNQADGWMDLEIKMSLLLLPLVIAMHDKEGLVFSKVMRAFVSGVLCSLLYLFTLAFYRYASTGDAEEFIYQRLSVLFHPTYHSMYIGLASLSILCLFADSFRYKKLTELLLYTLLQSFFLCSMSFLSARMSLISILLILPMVALLEGRKLGLTKRLTGSLLIPFLAMAGSVFYINSVRNDRLVQLGEGINQLEGNVSRDSITSASSRLYLWRYSAEQILQQGVAGTGTGDVQDVLNAYYREKEFSYGYLQNLNPHNQLLQSSLQLGLLGFLFLTALFVLPVYYSIKYRYYLWLGFSLIIVLNSLTESVLEVQSGILFFSLFYSLFALRETKASIL